MTDKLWGAIGSIHVFIPQLFMGNTVSGTGKSSELQL